MASDVKLFASHNYSISCFLVEKVCLPRNFFSCVFNHSCTVFGNAQSYMWLWFSFIIFSSFWIIIVNCCEYYCWLLHLV